MLLKFWLLSVMLGEGAGVTTFGFPPLRSGRNRPKSGVGIRPTRRSPLFGKVMIGVEIRDGKSRCGPPIPGMVIRTPPLPLLLSGLDGVGIPIRGRGKGAW